MASENTPDDLHDLELEALAVALRENRPEPTREFADRLDTAVTDHFPPEWSENVTHRSNTSFFQRLKERFEGGRQVLLPATAGLAGLLVVAVVVGVGMNGDGGTTDTISSTSDSSVSESTGAAGGGSAGTIENAAPSPSTAAPELYTKGNQSGGANSQFQDSGEQLTYGDDAVRTSKSPGAYAAGVNDRKVAQEADITLGTDPENVQDVSNDIVEVVDDRGGIVLDSSVLDGPAGQAGASFSLLIPSAQLESAVSDLSGIADLRSRSQETEDITAPTLTVEDSLRDSRARVDSLVKELSEATTTEDRNRIEDDLALERRQAARLSTKLNRLERRANLTPVGVTVETGGDTSASGDDSSWGIGEAIDDAGNMLGVSAGVALIALAIAIPIGLVVLIALALNRAWVRHSRRRALKEN